MTPRQLSIAAAAFQGIAQEQIARDLDISQATVCRELKAAKDACLAVGVALPGPLKIDAAGQEQLDHELEELLW